MKFLGNLGAIRAYGLLETRRSQDSVRVKPGGGLCRAEKLGGHRVNPSVCDIRQLITLDRLIHDWSSQH